MRNNQSMLERVTVAASLACAVLVAAAGFFWQWALSTLVFCSLGVLVLGLAVGNVVGFITAPKGQPETKGDA